MNRALERWEYAWNCIRPHEALNYLTPIEYSNKIQLQGLDIKNSIILQVQAGNIYLNLDIPVET